MKPISTEGVGLICSDIFSKNFIEHINYTVRRKVDQYRSVTKYLSIKEPLRMLSKYFDPSARSGGVLVTQDHEPFKKNDVITYVRGKEVRSISEIARFERLCPLCHRRVIPDGVERPWFTDANHLRFFTKLKNKKSGDSLRTNYLDGTEDEVNDIMIVETPSESGPARKVKKKDHQSLPPKLHMPSASQGPSIQEDYSDVKIKSEPQKGIIDLTL